MKSGLLEIHLIARLINTLTQLEEAGNISKNNTSRINELGSRSILINEMVEIIKEKDCPFGRPGSDSVVNFYWL